MWLHLDASLQGVDPNSINARAALEQLLYAVGRGEHAAAALPATARHLLIGEFSPMPRTVLRHVLDAAPDILARLKTAKFRVNVVLNGVDPVRAGEGEWDLPIEWIRINGVPSSSILAENTRDAELYKVAASHHQILSRTGNSFSMDIGNGGGADTPRVLTAEIGGKRRFVLCITDSDRGCPTAPRNHTSAQCKKLCGDSNWVSAHLMLEEREIENVVPTNLVEDALVAIEAAEQLAKLAALREICKQDARAWSFFDLKEGTPLRAMFGACSGFWSEFKEHPVCRAGTKAECVVAGECVDGDCRCLIAPPLGHRILEHVISYLSQNSTHSAAKRASTSPNAERWLAVGELVSSWGTATPKLRS